MKIWNSGNIAGTGTFRCTGCDSPLELETASELPLCPTCQGDTFIRASIFATSAQPVIDIPGEKDEDWERYAKSITNPGQYIIYSLGDEMIAHQLTREWTRIGRSLAADVRFDDPTVSRRHALVVRQPDGLRVLDDRSLNGVFVNGERVEWSTLETGDDIAIGRHHLHFIIR